MVVQGMISRGSGGSIVNVSTAASKMAMGWRVLYGASKAALDHLTWSMAVEFGKHQVSGTVECCNWDIYMLFSEPCNDHVVI